MSVAENKRLVARVFAEALNQGHLHVIDEIVAAAAIDHQSPDEPSIREHLKHVVTSLRTAFPDLHFAITEMVGEGEWVAVHLVMTGTNTGELCGPGMLPPPAPPTLPPTGRAVRVAHMNMIRFQDGRAIELWHVMDTMAMIAQLDARCAPGPAPADGGQAG
jgi:predicted ester cyclase